MATLATGPITSSDTGHFAQQYSKRLVYEGIIKNPVLDLLMGSGCVNKEDQLDRDSGGTVTMYNALRANTLGTTGDIDIYSNAQLLEKSTRTLNILKNSIQVTWPLRGTQTQQFASYDIGEPVVQSMIDWTKSIITASCLNQLGGNTATTITQYSASDSTSFTGSDLTRVTGNNSAIVPTYHYEANLGGVVTTDAGVDSGNVLSITDFELAAEIITSQQSGKPTWQILDGSHIGLAFISQTGFNQLKNQAVTNGQGQQLSNIIYYNLAGGKELDLMQFMLPGLPFKFVVVPDSWMPRGVTLSTGAETANTRRAFIVGKNALDMAFGKGFAPAGGKAMPGVNVKMDTEYKKLNNQGYAVSELLWGCKKAQQTAPGSGSSTAYDVSTYVIAHYSRT